MDNWTAQTGVGGIEWAMRVSVFKTLGGFQLVVHSIMRPRI